MKNARWKATVSFGISQAGWGMVEGIGSLRRLLYKRVTVLTVSQHILRLLNTNVKGTGKIMFALTEIKGVGRRYANLVCKKADVDMNKR